MFKGFPIGFKETWEDCGQIYFQSEYQIDYFSAFKKCCDLGMNLLSLETREELKCFILHTRDLSDMNITWTSASNLSCRKIWHWCGTNSSLADSNMIWADMAENRKNTVHNCALLDAKTGKMKSAKCDEANFFTCELPIEEAKQQRPSCFTSSAASQAGLVNNRNTQASVAVATKQTSLSTKDLSNTTSPTTKLVQIITPGKKSNKQRRGVVSLTTKTSPHIARTSAKVNNVLATTKKAAVVNNKAISTTTKKSAITSASNKAAVTKASTIVSTKVTEAKAVAKLQLNTKSAASVTTTLQACIEVEDIVSSTARSQQQSVLQTSAKSDKKTEVSTKSVTDKLAVTTKLTAKTLASEDADEEE